MTIKSTPRSFALVLTVALSGCVSLGSKRISTEAQAVRFLTDFVNRELSSKTFRYDYFPNPDFNWNGYLDNQSVQTYISGEKAFPVYRESDWDKIEFKNGRWIVTLNAVEGPGMYILENNLFISASVDMNGKNPKIEKCVWLPP